LATCAPTGAMNSSTGGHLMSRLNRALTLSLTSLAMLASCTVAGCSSDDPGSDVGNFSSDQATLLEFEFEGQLIARSVWSAERTIEDQMLYTIGHLNGEKAVGRLDQLEITEIEKTELEDGNTKVTYKAKLPVGWASKTNLPETYDLTLPLHVDSDDYQKFTEKYSHSCVGGGAHDVDTGSMWYYYRPNSWNCELDEADVFTTTAKVTVSEENTTGKYPEYHKLWEDDALTGVFIFGKYEDGATSGDSGITAYNNFVREMKEKFRDASLSTEPAEVPDRPGVDSPDITFRATLEDGKKIEVVALLVDNVRTAGYEFNERYEALSGNADIIAYNGHAGLGSNVRALASKGKFVTGKYQIFFMNGCDTFAYIDNQLQQAHADVNDDDPVGSRYLDMVTNVMPSYFHSMPYASMALMDGLLNYAEPETYEHIFKDIDRSEVVVVTGEEDNVYEPGFEPGGNGWEGLEESGAVAPGESMSFELGELPAGTYSISISHDEAAPGGDADLYVAVGREPTLDDYDERPYLYGSDEMVTVKLERATPVYVMVHGYEYEEVESSAFLLSAAPAE
jgi:hypothetical protein